MSTICILRLSHKLEYKTVIIHHDFVLFLYVDVINHNFPIHFRIITCIQNIYICIKNQKLLLLYYYTSKIKFLKDKFNIQSTSLEINILKILLSFVNLYQQLFGISFQKIKNVYLKQTNRFYFLIN